MLIFDGHLLRVQRKRKKRRICFCFKSPIIVSQLKKNGQNFFLFLFLFFCSSATFSDLFSSLFIVCCFFFFQGELDFYYSVLMSMARQLREIEDEELTEELVDELSVKYI